MRPPGAPVMMETLPVDFDMAFFLSRAALVPLAGGVRGWLADAIFYRTAPD